MRFGDVQEKLLTGWQKPIVLLDKKTSGSLCESVAPDNPTVGVMLPYAPLHLLLFDYDDGVEIDRQPCYDQRKTSVAHLSVEATRTHSARFQASAT